MFSVCSQIMWAHSHAMWSGEARYSQLIWSQNSDVFGPGDLCSRVATFRDREKESQQFPTERRSTRVAISRIVTDRTQPGQLRGRQTNQRRRSKQDYKERPARYPRRLHLLLATPPVHGRFGGAYSRRATHPESTEKKAGKSILGTTIRPASCAR